MKTAVVFHGTGGSPESYWIPYLKHNLEERGYKMLVPALPNPEHPQLQECLDAVLDLPYTEETILVGHSSGASLILALLERIPVKVKQAVLVAGFYKPLEPGKPELMVQASYDWEKIKAHCAIFTVINSDNDPWGCDDKMGQEIATHVGGEFILAKGEGHMGSLTFNQPYKEFPLLLGLIK